MKEIKMKYRQGEFVKYKNKLFPKWVGEHWIVWKTKTKGVGFRRFEEAQIYKAILDLKV